MKNAGGSLELNIEYRGQDNPEEVFQEFKCDAK
jgi:hypothetical protein